jgi:hypothetical protein
MELMMPYRNGTYIAFHANNTTEPDESDIRYYNLLKAWHVREEYSFEFVNSHEKTAAVRDTSKRSTLERALRTRLDNSKNMILIIGNTTREDRDWVPFEIRYAVDECRIPIIATYPGYTSILAPSQLSHLWPSALASRIDDRTAHVIHIPFRQDPLYHAVNNFDFNNYPNGEGVGVYSTDAYRSWRLL